MQSLRTYYSNGTSTMISLETEEEKSIYQFHDRMVSSHLVKMQNFELRFPLVSEENSDS